MSVYSEFNNNPYGSQVKVIEMVGKEKKVLEIGCATGRISQRLSENGCKVFGIEIDTKSATQARKYCEEVIKADIETILELPYQKKFFDIILLSNILEHLKSPQDTLNFLLKYLKDGGYVIIVLPNVTNYSIRLKLLFGNFEYEESGILDKTHLRFFNEKTAKELLNDANLEIIKYDIVPTIPIFPLPWKIKYSFSKMRPNLFASEFLFKAKKKDI